MKVTACRQRDARCLSQHEWRGSLRAKQCGICLIVSRNDYRCGLPKDGIFHILESDSPLFCSFRLVWRPAPIPIALSEYRLKLHVCYVLETDLDGLKVLLISIQLEYGVTTQLALNVAKW